MELNFENAVNYHYGRFPPQDLNYGKFVDLLRIPVMMDIESGEVGHPRSEATLDWINTYSGGQHRSR